MSGNVDGMVSLPVMKSMDEAAGLPIGKLDLPSNVAEYIARLGFDHFEFKLGGRIVVKDGVPALQCICIQPVAALKKTNSTKEKWKKLP